MSKWKSAPNTYQMGRCPVHGKTLKRRKMVSDKKHVVKPIFVCTECAPKK